MLVTRRTVVGAAAAAALTSGGWAKSRPEKMVRHSVATTAGKASLQSYAKAVAIMESLPAGDPRSWMYQWYIHSVPTDRTKDAELTRLFGSSAPGRELAAETWSTCRSHFGGMNADDFLPWHRMYLMCFETTIRSVLNEPFFTLPYWNYLDPAQKSLPAQFLRPSDPEFGSLFRHTRRPDVNAGLPIDGGVSGLINASSLAISGYRSKGLEQGFCEQIDGELHGTIHVCVGDRRGMGSVPWAANDPIFWLHHANVDRLWASWNANGGRNPASPPWTEQAFVLPSGTGGRARITSGQVSRLADAGYEYDALEPGPTILVATAEQAQRPQITVESAPAPVLVSPKGTRVALRRVTRPHSVAVAGTRLYLVLSDLAAPDAPGVVYRVDVGGGRDNWISVGHINFFESVATSPTPHEGHGQPRRFIFDVTDLLAGARGRPEVRIVPVGSPQDGLSVTVGRIDLVQN